MVYTHFVVLFGFRQNFGRSRSSEQLPLAPPLFASPGDIFNLLKDTVWSGEREKVRHASSIYNDSTTTSLNNKKISCGGDTLQDKYLTVSRCQFSLLVSNSTNNM